MADIGTAAAAMPEWIYWIGGVIGVATATFIARRGSADGKQEQAASNRVGAIAAIQPTADRMTQDALVQTMAALTLAIEKLTTLLERQERDREEEERAELRELRRIVREIQGEGGRR